MSSQISYSALVKLAKVISVRSGPPAPDDWEEGECLCEDHKAVPADKRIDYLVKALDKQGKPKWKIALRYHADCPIHGVNRCPEA